MHGVLIHDLNFKPLYVNKGYVKNLGYSVNEVMGLHTIDPLFSENQMNKARAFTKSGVSLDHFDKLDDIESEGRHKSGGLVVLHQSLTSVEWKGRPAIFLLALDITDKKVAHQAMQLSEERFRDFAESASDSCWELDKNLNLSFLSTPKNETEGLAIKELIEFNIEKLKDSNLKDQAELKLDPSLSDHLLDLNKRKPFNEREVKLISSEGKHSIFRVSGKPIFDSEGDFCGYRGVSRNVTNEISLSEQLQYQASHDELTGLINRRHFDNEMHKAIDEAIVHGSEHVLVFMDLDRFKIVNDTCGHMAGDELLQQIASMFKTIFSRRDILGRMGGDEFAVILKNCSPNQSIRITQKLHEEFDKYRFFWEGKSFSIGVSAGVASINRYSDSVSKLLQNVDSALYVAKQTGRNKTHIFSEKDEDFNHRQGEMRWISRIMDAVESDGFVLYAQSMMPLKDQSSGGFFELLIRMKDGDKLIAPGLFLPAAESYDLSIKIDKWVLRKALEWISSGPSALLNCQHVFINLSGKTIGNEEFQNYTYALLEEYSVPPEKICFEITETAAIANISQAIDFINNLKERGCYFALDDFGSGVSSFGYLKNLPVDYLKIDGMFVKDMSVNEVNLALIKSINDISHVMGKKTIAEFVEDDLALVKLTALGVDYAQGYHIARPLPLSELESF